MSLTSRSTLMPSNKWNTRRRRLRRPLVCKPPIDDAEPQSQYPASIICVYIWDWSDFAFNQTSKNATLPLAHVSGGNYVGVTTDDQGRAVALTAAIPIAAAPQYTVAVTGFGFTQPTGAGVGTNPFGGTPWTDGPVTLVQADGFAGSGQVTASA